MPDSLAERTRRAVRARPTLYDALRVGVLNYAAAARTLDVEGDADSVATALRRYREDLPETTAEARDARVRVVSGVGPAEDSAEPLLAVGDVVLDDGGRETAVVATGAVDVEALRAVLGRLVAADVGVSATGVAGETLVVVVERADGPDALRHVEDALASVPS